MVDVPDVGNGPRVAVGERHHALVAERDDGLAGRGVEAEELIARVEQHAQLVAVLRVTPKRRRAVLEPGAGNAAERHGSTVETPQLPAGLRVERRGVVVGRRDVEHAVDHQRLVLEPVGRRPVLLERLLAVLPLPGDREPRDVLRRDVVGGRVLAARRIAAVGEPLHLPGLASRRREDPYDEDRSRGSRSPFHDRPPHTQGRVIAGGRASAAGTRRTTARCRRAANRRSRRGRLPARPAWHTSPSRRRETCRP